LSFWFCFLTLHFQPVPATNDDMMHARGPAPGNPYHWLPVTARNPPAPSKNALWAVTDCSIFLWQTCKQIISLFFFFFFFF
jgi:hypothetical protein